MTLALPYAGQLIPRCPARMIQIESRTRALEKHSTRPNFRADFSGTDAGSLMGGGAGYRKPERGLHVRSGTRGLADRRQPTENPDVLGLSRWLRSRRVARERETGGVCGRWPPGRMAQDWAGFSEEELRRLRQSKGKGRGRWETPRR